jgi:CheY-like chemotaxis protein
MCYLSMQNTENFSTGANLEGMTILVVDDDNDSLELVTFILSDYKINVTRATSAAEALILLSESLPDLILCDIGMPEVDGYTLMREIRTLPAQKGGTVPAIAITAYGNQEVSELSTNADFQDYLIKPFDPLELLLKIKSASKKNNTMYLGTEREAWHYVKTTPDNINR